MKRLTCARALAILSGANTSVKSRRPRVMKRNLSQPLAILVESRLPCFSVQRTEGVYHVQTFIDKRDARVDSVLGVKQLPSPSDVLESIAVRR